MEEELARNKRRDKETREEYRYKRRNRDTIEGIKRQEKG
jgi:hypothetical protein